MKEPPTLELVLKRNSVERLKRDKSPLGILDELPALIASGYEQVDEEDIVRLKWWGLYHDKPKIGTFMLRVKIAGGVVTPAQLRALGEIWNAHGPGSGRLLRCRGDQLHRPGRRAARRRGGLRRPRRRRALVGAADRTRARDLGAEGGCARGACGDPRRVARGPPLPRLAGEGPPQVHDR